MCLTLNFLHWLVKKKYFIKHPEFCSCLDLIMSFASQDDSEILKYAKVIVKHCEGLFEN